MKLNHKILALFAALLLISAPAFSADANVPNTVSNVLSGASLAVASTNTAYSQSFILPRNVSFGAEFLFDSSGSVDVKIELEEGNQAVTTEGSADSTWGVGQTVSTGVTVETPTFLAVAPVVAKYARFKFTGQGANHASTVLTKIKIAFSENS